MDLTVMRYISIQGKEDEPLKKMSIYMPISLSVKDIMEITPEITKDGKFYKNVSNIRNSSGEFYTVVGNYKQITEHIKGMRNRKTVEGFLKKRNDEEECSNY